MFVFMFDKWSYLLQSLSKYLSKSTLKWITTFKNMIIYRYYFHKLKDLHIKGINMPINTVTCMRTFWSLIKIGFESIFAFRQYLLFCIKLINQHETFRDLRITDLEVIRRT